MRHSTSHAATPRSAFQHDFLAGATRRFFLTLLLFWNSELTDTVAALGWTSSSIHLVVPNGRDLPASYSSVARLSLHFLTSLTHMFFLMIETSSCSALLDRVTDSAWLPADVPSIGVYAKRKIDPAASGPAREAAAWAAEASREAVGGASGSSEGGGAEAMVVLKRMVSTSAEQPKSKHHASGVGDAEGGDGGDADAMASGALAMKVHGQGDSNPVWLCSL